MKALTLALLLPFLTTVLAQRRGGSTNNNNNDDADADSGSGSDPGSGTGSTNPDTGSDAPAPAPANPRPSSDPSPDSNSVSSRARSSGASTTICDSFTSYTSSCGAETTSWASLSASQLASCACYSQGYFVPEAFDSAANRCASARGAQAETASSFVAVCESQGNVRSAPTATAGQFSTPASAAAQPTGSTSSTAAANELVLGRNGVEGGLIAAVAVGVLGML